jgi:long-chain acyl-CoA synthetase
MNNQIEFLQNVFSQNHESDAIIWNNRVSKYSDLNLQIEIYIEELNRKNIEKGAVVALIGDFTPNCIALLIALISRNCIIVPLTIDNKNTNKLYEIAGVEFVFQNNQLDNFDFEINNLRNRNIFYSQLIELNHPGLVLFSSGTSGEPKCAVHDFVKLLAKFHERKRALRTLNFLLFDHWGGLNTMFHILSNGGVVISSKERSPVNICKLIEKYNIELLPSSPTFLNLLLLSEVYRNYNLSSLSIISYGTEPMLPATLVKLKTVFPNVKLLQTYGLIEVGVLKTNSKSNDSLWVKLGGNGYDLRVVDGLLEIKAESAMLGYLNYASPFTEDGWFKTGDAVEVDGEYFKILGRKSEIINVGGEKVFPVEIENVINEVQNVLEVMVYGEKNPITGNIVVAKISLLEQEDKATFIKRLKNHCRSKLENFKIPVKVIIDNTPQYGSRLKKNRTQ